jgi:hypothetical protein
MRSVNNIVATIDVIFFPEILNGASNNRSLWMPENKTAAGIFL